MQFISADCETSGLDPMVCQILEVGAVMADLQGHIYSRFHFYVHNKRIRWEDKAREMNERLLDVLEVERRKPVVPWEQKDLVNFTGWVQAEYLAYAFYQWIYRNRFLPTRNDRSVWAGKNFGSFDWQFFKHAVSPSIPDFLYSKKMYSVHRFVDPSILWMDPEIDEVPPDLTTCLSRAGIDKVVTHDALDDCIDVVNVLAAYYKKRTRRARAYTPSLPNRKQALARLEGRYA